MSLAPRPVDPVDRAHLTGVSAPSPPIHRYDVPAHLRTIARRHWIPVWHLPDGEVWTQKVLQYRSASSWSPATTPASTA